MAESSENGTATVKPERAPEPEIYRAHNTPKPEADLADLAKQQRESARQMKESVERIERVCENMAKVMARSDAPAAAISHTSREVTPPQHSAEFLKTFREATDLSRLKKTMLENGSMEYRLQDNAWDAVVSAVTDRAAFVEHGPTLTGLPSHIEVLSADDRAIKAAMLHAKLQWGDEIRIHVGQKHAEKLVRHAVEHGLIIANKDPYTMQLVAAERERQANPLVRGRDLGDSMLIERVSSRRDVNQAASDFANNGEKQLKREQDREFTR
jgi:hypothetical protein